jgi:hypothetical protein
LEEGHRVGDETLTQTLRDNPKIIREHGEHLEPVACGLPANSLVDSAVQLYEHLVEQAIESRDSDYYAEAGAFCKVIRSIRRMQGRESEFERYCQGLFATYSCLSAFKGGLLKAIRGNG